MVLSSLTISSAKLVQLSMPETSDRCQVLLAVNTKNKYLSTAQLRKQNLSMQLLQTVGRNLCCCFRYKGCTEISYPLHCKYAHDLLFLLIVLNLSLFSPSFVFLSLALTLNNQSISLHSCSFLNLYGQIARPCHHKASVTSHHTKR